MKDLKFPSFLAPIVLSEEEGFEKPSNEIFARTLKLVNEAQASRIEREVEEAECLHIGDELDWRVIIKFGFSLLAELLLV